MLNFLEKAGMNTYFRAPIGEPSHCRSWQDARPSGDLTQLHISATNDCALIFYEKFGFSEIYSDESQEILALTF
jgi:ribosomal protein S18 acetylase RimI-like enzyme